MMSYPTDSLVAERQDRQLLQDFPDGTLKEVVVLLCKLAYWATLSPTERANDMQTVCYPTNKISLVESVIGICRDLSNSLESILPTVLQLLGVQSSEELLVQLRSQLETVSVFLERTEKLLTDGGDDRLSIDFSATKKLNKYLSSTIPNEALIRRGSCTCSSMVPDSYEEVDAIRRRIMLYALQNWHSKEQLRLGFDNLNQSLISRISSVIAGTVGVSDDVATSTEFKFKVVMFPSGSDAEFLPLIAAMIRSYNLSGGNSKKVKVFNFVTAAGEVGSGTPNAASGKHFSAAAPKGPSVKQKNGEFLVGMRPEWVELVEYKPRDGKSGSIDFKEQEIVDAVRSKLHSEAHCVAVLHVVVGSKTGLIYPSISSIQSLQQEYGERLVVVADACQLRCRIECVQKYIALGFVTLITSSKFYTGAPFSGGVVLPDTIATELETHLTQTRLEPESCVVPAGLRDYLTPHEVPDSMPAFRAFLADGEPWMNVGLHLRWAGGLSYMEKYARLESQRVSAFTVAWVQHVKSLVKAQAPFLQLVEEEVDKEGMDDEMIGRVNSIVSIAICVSLSSSDVSQLKLNFLNADECKLFHKLMTIDGIFDNKSANCQAMLGQPVKLASNGFAIVRIALGADMVISALSKRNSNFVDELYQQDELVVQKMGYLARCWDFYGVNNGGKSINEPTVSSPERDAAVCQQFSHADQDLLLKSFPITCSDDSSPSVSTAGKIIKALFNDTKNMPNVVILYDLDTLAATTANLLDSFSTILKSDDPDEFHANKFLHCFAIKSCPLPYIIHFLISRGLGLEAASVNEVKQGLRCGCPAEKIVYDSPCKTREEVMFALRQGVQINANSVVEVQKIASCLDELSTEGKTSQSRIGLRVNPLVGAGTVTELSVSKISSKFGLPISSSVASAAMLALGDTTVEDFRPAIVDLFLQHRFLTMIMCHVGSQGMALETLAEGSKRILALADMIDEACAKVDGYTDNKTRGYRVQAIDIGGGLSANYLEDTASPSFADYASTLLALAPTIANQYPRVLMTEFGKSIITKSGIIAGKVEDVWECGTINTTLSPDVSQRSDTSCSSAKDVCAITHVGADLLLRTCYVPAKFPQRVALVDCYGNQVAINDSHYENKDSDEIHGRAITVLRKSTVVTVHGPLCFGGDVLKYDLEMPSPKIGDYCIVRDVGANSLSLFSHHCSRASPAVYCYRYMSMQLDTDITLTKPIASSVPVIACIRREDSSDKVVQFW